jgi:hypothetical protein
MFFEIQPKVFGMKLVSSWMKLWKFVQNYVTINDWCPKFILWNCYNEKNGSWSWPQNQIINQTWNQSKLKEVFTHLVNVEFWF